MTSKLKIEKTVEVDFQIEVEGFLTHWEFCNTAETGEFNKQYGFCFEDLTPECKIELLKGLIDEMNNEINILISENSEAKPATTYKKRKVTA